MVTEDFDIQALRQKLLTDGSVHAVDRDGRKLFIIHSRMLQGAGKGYLVAYEGRGAFFFNMERPMNRFRLVQAGFPYSVAPWLSDLLNNIVGFQVRPRERQNVPLLNGPVCPDQGTEL